MLVNIDRLTTLSHTQCLFLSHVMVWMGTINRTCYKYLKHWYVFLFLFTVLSDTWGQFRIHVFSNTIGKPIHSQHGLCMVFFFTVIWEHRCHLMFSTNFMRCTCTKLKVYWNFYVVFLIFLLMNETLHFFF